MFQVKFASVAWGFPRPSLSCDKPNPEILLPLRCFKIRCGPNPCALICTWKLSGGRLQAWDVGEGSVRAMFWTCSCQYDFLEWQWKPSSDHSKFGSAVFYLSSPWRGLPWMNTWGAACAALQVFISSFRVSREYILHTCTVRGSISSRPVVVGHRLITGRTSGFSSFCGWLAFGNVYPAVKILFVHLLSNIIPSFEANYGDDLWGFQRLSGFGKAGLGFSGACTKTEASLALLFLLLLYRYKGFVAILLSPPPSPPWFIILINDGSSISVPDFFVSRLHSDQLLSRLAFSISDQYYSI